MTITTRSGKGSELTYVELDGNFDHLGAHILGPAPTGNDQTAEIEEAISDLPSTGGVVQLRGGTYVTTGIETDKANVTIAGTGNVGQSAGLGSGSTVIEVSGANVGFTFNAAASSSVFRGPMLTDVHFKGSGSALGAVLIKRTNNWLLRNVAASGFTTGYGCKSDGTGNVNQYGTFIECKIHNCLTGYHGLLSNGIVFIGGYMDGDDNSGDYLANATAIKQVSGDTLRIFGTRIQLYETGIDLQGGESHEIHGPRIEGVATGLKIATTGARLFGGNFNNNILGGTSGTAIEVTATASRAELFPGHIGSFTNKISDSGSRTFYLLENEMKFDTGITLLRLSDGNLRIINNVYAEASFVAGNGGTGSYFLNGASGPYISAGTATPEGAVTAPVGSLFLRTNGGASTTLYVKESGTGNTGWVAK